MSELDDIRPITKHRVMDLLQLAGMDVSDWGNYRGRVPAANPRSYDWSFVQPGEFVVVCLWWSGIRASDGEVSFALSPADYSRLKGAPGSPNWIRRSNQLRANVELAYRESLPVRVVVVEGRERRVDEDDPVSSSVSKRLLDDKPWAVKSYDYRTGSALLTRGLAPVPPPIAVAPDVETSAYEGAERLAFVRHKAREARFRRKKLEHFRALNSGRLFCEVTNCGFDFSERYGELGFGFAEVHHLSPLKNAPKSGQQTKLSDLAVVCANCHRMIHRGGKCRELTDLSILSSNG